MPNVIANGIQEENTKLRYEVKYLEKGKGDLVKEITEQKSKILSLERDKERLFASETKATLKLMAYEKRNAELEVKYKKLEIKVNNFEIDHQVKKKLQEEKNKMLLNDKCPSSRPCHASKVTKAMDVIQIFDDDKVKVEDEDCKIKMTKCGLKWSVKK